MLLLPSNFSIKITKRYKRALAVVEKLMAVKNRTPEQNALLDLLVILIENFEDEHYQQRGISIFINSRGHLSTSPCHILRGSKHI